MAKYRKKPVVVEAYQWFEVSEYVEGVTRNVDYYRTPDACTYCADSDKDCTCGQTKCKHCGRIMHDHGWVDTLEGGLIACPGDYIITGVQGEIYPCKSDIFEATYEKVEEK